MTRSRTFERNTIGNALNDHDARHPRHQLLLSALLSPLGPPAKLLPAWEQVHARRSRYAHSELREVTARPFFRARLRPSAAELLAAGVRDFSFFASDLPSGPITPDPKDSFLLALAQSGQAEFLVTGAQACVEITAVTGLPPDPNQLGYLLAIGATSAEPHSLWLRISVP